MTRRGALFYGLGFALAVAIPAAGHADPRPDPGPIARRIHDRGRYPADLLVEPEPTGEGGRRARGRPVPIYGGRDAPIAPPDPSPSWWPDWDLDLPWLGRLFAWLGKGALFALVGAILAVVAFVVYLLFKMRPAIPLEAKGTATRKKAPEQDVVTEDPLLRIPELGHDELARLGRFREATHALLVTALLETGWSPEGRGRGLTAREIVASYAKPAPPRAPLDSLLGIVEHVWFGGREATRTTYDEALAHFRAFVPTEATA